MPRLSLAHQIFLGTAVAVATVLGATLAVTSVTARRAAERAIDRGLLETNARVVDRLRARQGELTARLGVFAQNRDVMQVILRDTVGGDALDQAGVAAEASGARWVQIVDARGVRIAKSDDPTAERIDLSGAPIIAGALQGEPTGAFGVMGDTAVIQVVAVPMVRDLNNSRSVVAALMAAQVVDDSLASAIGAATGSELAFYATSASGAVRIAASSVAPASRPALQRAVGERMMRDTTTRQQVEIDGVTYVGQRTPLRSAAGEAVAGVVALRSLDAELAGYHDLRRILLLTGALGLLLAFALSGAIARRIVRPVTALVGATRRAADGDYDAEIPAGGPGEIGTLAEAVRRLLDDLRDKQALVDFLGGGAAATSAAMVSGATQPMPAAGGAALLPGQSLGARYDVRALLGAGGMGMVYRAHDRELGEMVAIKTLKPELIAADETALERFKSELRLARKISHRNVVRTHDLGESNGVYYITMEFVEGTSLKELVLRRGRLPVHVMLPIAKQLCRALEVAHDAGVIHRDIKPQNMVVEADGTLKVMDFGIARLASRAPNQGLTQAGMIVGTPEYMAPEQLLGDEVDARADLYAAGVVMYECLTGALPFVADSVITLIAKVLEETPSSPHQRVPEVPEALSDLVMRTMARDRDHRPRTAEALHDALAQLG